MTKMTKKEVVDTIVKDIKATSKKTDDAPGVIFIPTFRTKEQVDNIHDDDSFGAVETGVVTNVKDAVLFQLGLVSALKGYVKSPMYERRTPPAFKNIKLNDKDHAALMASSIYSSLLGGTSDIARHLAMTVVNTVEHDCTDRDVLFLMLPSNISNAENFEFNVQNNSGMACSTHSVDDFVRMLATAGLAFCTENGLSVEEIGERIFHEMMTSQIVTEKNKKGDE